MNESILNASQEVRLGVIDMTSLGRSQLRDLVELFYTIRTTLDENSRAYRLAGIGMYLADEWQSDLQETFESLDRSLKRQEARSCATK